MPWEAMQIAPPRAVAPDAPASAAKATSVTQRVPAKTSIVSATEKQVLINVGLFAVEENARKAYAKLQDAGLPATLQPFTTAKGERFRVRVGPYTSRRDAEVAAEKVRSLSLEALVIDAP